MMDYSQYILDYEEATGKRIPGRQRVLRFLNLVQTKNVRVDEWRYTFYEYEDLILESLAMKSKSVYRNQIIRFIEYTEEHFHGKQQSVIQSYDRGGNAILKHIHEKEEKPVRSIGELKSKPVEEKKPTKRDSKRSKKKHTTKIVSDWRKL